MASPEARALSIQAQYALELLAEQVGNAAAYLMASAVDFEPASVERMARQYEALIAGAVVAVAGIRAGYLQAFAEMSGQPAVTIPASVARPDLTKVLVGGQSPTGAVYSTIAQLNKWIEEQQQVLIDQGEDIAADVVDRVMQQRDPQVMATQVLRDYAESTLMAASDYIDGEVLGPIRRVVALRRVAHPKACERCIAVSGVLVFKERPALRHPQCRCSFEPVYINDTEYQKKLANYRANAESRSPGRIGSDARRRGREQLRQARFQEESEWLQSEWRDFLTEEQVRLSEMVKAVKSDTYTRWAVMTSADITGVGGDLLPVITRN